MKKSTLIGCFDGVLMHSAGLGAATLIEITESECEATKTWFEGRKQRSRQSAAARRSPVT